MNMMQGDFRPTVPRRVEALAFIIQRIRSSGTAPSYGEIGRAMNPQVQGSRARQYVEQLVKLGVIERHPASRRGIMIRDHGRCRQLIDEALGMQGWYHAPELGVLEPPPYTFQQLPKLPPFEHLPDPEYSGTP
jgi:SOS-response transcriptional repressor LexA